MFLFQGGSSSYSSSESVLVLVCGCPGTVGCKSGSRVVLSAASATPSHGVQCHCLRHLGKHREP